MSDNELKVLEKKVFESENNDAEDRRAFDLDDKLSEAADRLKRVLEEENKWKKKYCNHYHINTQ